MVIWAKKRHLQPELAHPYDVLKEKVELVFASPKGGRAPLDPGSVEQFEADPTCAHFLKHHQATWQTTQPLASFVGRAATEFDAVFYPGGHGPMLDLMNDADSHHIIEELWRAGKPVATVCHGPIVFIRVAIDGTPLLNGRRATGFTNKEEADVGLVDAMPVLLEDEAKRCGALWQQATEPWGACVVVDGQLVFVNTSSITDLPFTGV